MCSSQEAIRFWPRDTKTDTKARRAIPAGRCCKRADAGSVDGFRVYQILVLRAACHACDLDAARFQNLGDFAHKVDVQHSIGMGCLGHADMIGQREAPLERACGDPAMR